MTVERVVVIGASGNIGTSVLESLAADPQVGSTVAVARRLPRWTVPKTRWVSADVARDDLAEVVRGADVVIHLAWLFQPTHHAAVTWRNNVLGAIRVFDAVARAGVPALVYSSSVGAYSPGPKDSLVDESWPTHGWPEAAYCREKAYLERVLDTLELRYPGIRLVRLRPGFVFKHESASEQRRLFAGPLLPNRLVRPGAVPVVPDLPRLKFQVLHSADAGEAFRLAAVRPVRGAFNLAAEPVVDAALLARCLQAKVMRMPAWPARAALSAAWRLHLVPASPDLFDAVLQLPLMDTSRAGSELGWTPRHSAEHAIGEFLRGLRDSAGMPTPPLAAEGANAGRLATNHRHQ
jgi:nucleoside-diphosphate-sugar epimerase